MVYMQMPPEVRQMIEHQRMHAEANAHATLDFLRSLDEEQLRAFRGVLSAVNVTDDTVPYYMGLVGGMLHEKYGVCLGCGLKHDEELKNLTGEGPTEEASAYTVEQFIIDCENYAVEATTPLNPNSSVECVGPCSEKGGERGRWQNIHARMERKAGTGGCDFCVSIQKWG